jgi:hypothetical protein
MSTKTQVQDVEKVKNKISPTEVTEMEQVFSEARDFRSV